MKLKSMIFTLIMIISIFLSGCSEEQSVSDDKISIYTTIYPLEFFTEKIGGEHISVSSIIPPGADAHTFEPTARTMTQIAEADGFIYTGIGLEGFVDAVTESLSKEKVAFIAAGDGIDLHSEEVVQDHEEDDHAHEEENHDHEESASHDDHDHGDVDPHVWIDPILSISLAENIKEALIKLAPEHTEEFEQSFLALKEELEALDQEFQQAVSSAAHHEILVSHAAYGYWESRYGIEQISVTGLSPTQEPSQRQLQTIIETAKEHDIKYILFEQNVTGKVAEVVKKEIGAEALMLHNLESLTDDDLQNNEDYLSLMRKNIETLQKAMK
ncbi:metal ABC transporter solute-binding protein, Zn/Mn family [Bacillus sp. PS06]|uniref:metal ABC transporter solute-binding protein, Zn/Mn family n=1 Tax=Bacillus sp. PS06 TaxID=2764176 RepID=UPI001782AAA1|nr:zinc ABC transporter substrate-binding protein [Bacillus sp. PS06]MBD8068559.1 zinc ABC transporter substrate-binding protein [Bacillus sp. PS06]